MSSEDVKKQIRLHNRFGNQFRSAVRGALKKQYDHYTSSLKSHGAQYVLDHPAPPIDGNLTEVISRLYVSVGVQTASLTYRALQRLPKVQRKATGVIGFNAGWTKKITDYFTGHLFDKVVLPISDTTKQVIEAKIKEGVEKGWTLDRMVLEIERKDYLNGRVERILRTEINRAINYGNQLAADSFPYKTKKEWIAVDDFRTRPAHRAADGQIVELDEKFLVGGEELEFPGDPNGSPENTINCRCVQSIVPDRDDRGALQPAVEDSEPVQRVTGALRDSVLDAIRDLLN